MWNSASLKFCHGSVMFDQADEWKKSFKKIDQTRHFSRLIAMQKADRYMILCGEENGLLTSPYWQFCWWHDILVLFQNPAWQAHTDYGCILVGLSGQVSASSSRARAGHFAATPQSDVVRICTHDFGVMAMLSVRQKMPFLCAFMTLRSQFHLHHRAQRAFTEIVSKITPNLGLVL